MKPETERWVNRAEEDLETAAVALDHNYLSTCMFHNHEAVEKVLKAIWIETRGELAEKTHNLPYLARELELELSEAQREFLGKLSEQYLPTRYGDEWIEMPRETAENYYRTSRDIYSW